MPKKAKNLDTCRKKQKIHKHENYATHNYRLDIAITWHKFVSIADFFVQLRNTNIKMIEVLCPSYKIQNCIKCLVHYNIDQIKL